MKKIVFFFLIPSILFILTSCNKTDVDMELENIDDGKNLMSDKEASKLSNDDEFNDDYQEAYNDAVIEETEKQKMDLINEIEDIKEDKKNGKTTVWSCNMISESSTCIDYYGSFWTSEQIKLWCENGKYSKQWCPRDYIWWCNTGLWTMADMVSWIYLRWGGGMDAESIKYAKQACNATFISNWIDK